jgi:hypothetical protein
MRASRLRYRQPYRRHLYGTLFLKPCAYICYADHGCAGRFDFVKHVQHTQFLIDFLSDFIAEPEHRRRDPTVEKADDRVYIRHAGKVWAELPGDLLNNHLEVRRRLTRIIISYCKPLMDAMRNAGPESLMRTIRDSMIVYYEAYKLPESSFIHGGKQ